MQEAKKLLTYAFANDVMERIKFQPLRERLAERLYARLASRSQDWQKLVS